MNKHFDILFRNFDVFQRSGQEAKSLKSFVFKTALSGRLDFQKLSEGRVKQPLKALIEEQKAYLQKEGVSFSMFSDDGHSLKNLQESQTAAKSQPAGRELKKQIGREGNATAEQPDSLWPIVKLGDICKLLRGVTYSKKDETAKGGNIVLRANNIDIDGYLNLKEVKRINKEFDKTQRLIKNDIFICLASGSISHIGKTAFIEKNTDCHFGGFMGCIRANKEILSKYLFHLFHDCKFNKYLASAISGTNINNLSKKILYNYTVPLPPLEIQKEIVSLMEKCALLETQAKEKSQKQEEFAKSSMYFIAQAENRTESAYRCKRLKDNFKDILYSENGAKEFKAMAFQLCLNGRLNFQKLSKGRVKQPLKALVEEQKAYLQKEGVSFSMFSDDGHSLKNLQESQTAAKSQSVRRELKKQIGQEGNAIAEQPDSLWPIVKLGDICKLLRGVTYSKKDETAKGGNIVLRANNIDIDGYLNLKEIKRINKEFDKTQRLIKNDIFICLASGSISHIGKTAFIEKNTDCHFGGFMGCIRANKEILSKYLFHLFHDCKFNKYLASAISGTNINNLSKKILYNYTVPLPPLEIQKEIVSLMEHTENMNKQIQEEKDLRVRLAQSLSHLDNRQNAV